MTVILIGVMYRMASDSTCGTRLQEFTMCFVIVMSLNVVGCFELEIHNILVNLQCMYMSPIMGTQLQHKRTHTGSMYLYHTRTRAENDART